LKTRRGLVSNSSSSSFLVVFPRKPKGIEEVHEYLYNNAEGSINYYNDEHMSYRAISERVFNDTLNLRKASKKEITEEFSTQWYHAKYDIETKIKRGTDPVELMFSMGIDNADSIGKMIEVCRESVLLDDQHRREQSNLRRKYGYKVDGYLEEEDTTDEYKEENRLLEQKHFDARHKIWNKEQKIIKEIASDEADKWIEDHKDWWYTVLGYADEDDQGILEHGDIFRHIEHMVISHH